MYTFLSLQDLNRFSKLSLKSICTIFYTINQFFTSNLFKLGLFMVNQLNEFYLVYCNM